MTGILKEHDSPVAVLFAGRISSRFVPLARRHHVSPNAVTLASFFATLLAAASIAFAGRAGGIVGAVLIVAGFVLDCLDGQLARATGRTSDFGRYLDSLTDLVKVFALIVALAVADAHGGGRSGVLLGSAAFFGYLLCEYHSQIVRSLPQHAQEVYERTAAPWKDRLRIGTQKIDLAFAIGEVLFTVAAGAAIGRPAWALGVIAVLTPVQFLSYTTRFWRHRYDAAGSKADR